MRLKSCFLLALLPTACGLSTPAIRRHASLSPHPASARLLTPRPPAARTPAPRAQQSSDASDDFTSAQKMREEVEAPFAKVRLFAFPVLFAAAAIATYFSATSILAAAVGAREASESAFTDLAIDLASMAAAGSLWRREVVVRDARLRRIAFGSRLAALRVSQLAVQRGGESVERGQERLPHAPPYPP